MVRDAIDTWLRVAVVGLNLCPFARLPLAAGRVRIVVSEATTAHALLAELGAEAVALLAAEPRAIETTLLVAAHMFPDFLDFNDFLEPAEGLLADLGFEGRLQIASFHPAYRFADAPEDDVAHCTNRAPFPVLQLLREDSVAAVLRGVSDPDEIWRRNVRLLRTLGHDGWRRLMRGDT